MSFLIAYESCMPPHTPAMMVMRGFTFHPLLCRVLMSGSYSMCSSLRAWLGNLSWQYEDFMNWIVVMREGIIGVWIGLGLLLCIGWPI